MAEKAMISKLNLFFIAFGALSTNAISGALDYPHAWPQLSDERFDGSACPIIAGLYNYRGERYRVSQEDDGSLNEEHSLNKGGWIFFFHPRKLDTRKTPVESNATLKQDQVWIAQDSPGRYEIRILNKTGGYLESKVFDKELGDFACSDGHIVLSKDEGVDGSSEGRRVKMQVEVSLTRANDGSILFHQENKTESGSFFFGTKKSITNDYYRFFQIK